MENGEIGNDHHSERYQSGIDQPHNDCRIQQNYIMIVMNIVMNTKTKQQLHTIESISFRVHSATKCSCWHLQTGSKVHPLISIKLSSQFSRHNKRSSIERRISLHQAELVGMVV